MGQTPSQESKNPKQMTTTSTEPLFFSLAIYNDKSYEMIPYKIGRDKLVSDIITIGQDIFRKDNSYSTLIDKFGIQLDPKEKVANITGDVFYLSTPGINSGKRTNIHIHSDYGEIPDPDLPVIKKKSLRI